VIQEDIVHAEDGDPDVEDAGTTGDTGDGGDTAITDIIAQDAIEDHVQREEEHVHHGIIVENDAKHAIAIEDQYTI